MTTSTAASSLGASGGTSTAGLADWAAPYITDYLGKSQALSNMPYQTYGGPLTAGQSGLQSQAFQGIGNLTVGGTFDNAQAQAYMNPYLQQALAPQMKELQRQSDMQRMSDAGRLTQAGAFGGSRQAIMESEGRRNLLDKQSDVLGQGYATAYDKAMGQFNTDQNSRRLNYDQMLKAGGVQRDIEQQGITADLNEFNTQREYPYKQLQFQRDMISGLPTGSVTNSPSQLSGIASLISAAGGIDKLLSATGGGDLKSLLQKLGLNF
jgi:hypothetical protein